MTREEYDRLGHITETGKCCFCGKEYTDYGYSTWGVWNAEEEHEAFGENKCCCAECNEKIVNEARREKATAIEQEKIENVLQDFFEVIYERRSKGLVEGGESIIRIYDNGLYRKILLPREKYKGKKIKGERKDIVYGKELSVVPKLREFYRENQEEIDSLSDRLKDPYDDRRKRVARSLEFSRKKYVESRHAHA